MDSFEKQKLIKSSEKIAKGDTRPDCIHCSVKMNKSEDDSAYWICPNCGQQFSESVCSFFGF